MKILKVLLIIFFNCINIYGQNTSKGKIIYKYTVNEEKFNDDKNQAVVNNFKNSLKKSRDKIKFQLLFNDKEASYKLEKNLNSSSDRFLTYAILITGGTEEFYVNEGTKEQLKKIDFIGENFIIKSKIKSNWILTQETKQIGNYICYRAILNQSNKQKLTKIKLPEINAWYSPKIPLRFGPKGYGNLPGLILKLSIGPISYVATKIELNSNEKVKIIKPKKGKLITEKEFNEILMRIHKQKSK